LRWWKCWGIVCWRIWVLYFGKALFVEVQVCTGLQEFGSSVFVEEDGFSLTSYTFKLEVFHPEVFVQFNGVKFIQTQQ
jgi:hypothetical protein